MQDRPHEASPRAAPAADDSAVLARFSSELDLVDLVARQVSRRISRVLTLDDLRSFGREGLLQAARTFDPTRGVPFRRWANVRIRGAMIDGVRQWGGLPRRVYRELRALEAGDRVLETYDAEDAAAPAATAEAADQRLSSYLAGIATAIAVGTLFGLPQPSADTESAETPEQLVSDAQTATELRALLAELPERERQLLELHYFGGETLEAAGASLGLSKSWASRLHARAIESLARQLRKRGGR